MVFKPSFKCVKNEKINLSQAFLKLETLIFQNMFNNVNRLKKDFNHKAGINKRQSARKFNISQQRVCQLLQNNVICARKKKRYLVALNSKKL